MCAKDSHITLMFNRAQSFSLYASVRFCKNQINYKKLNIIKRNMIKYLHHIPNGYYYRKAHESYLLHTIGFN